MVWNTKNLSITYRYQPLKIALWDPARVIIITQYPLSPDGHLGLQPITVHLLKAYILMSTHSPYNTIILPIKKT